MVEEIDEKPGKEIKILLKASKAFAERLEDSAFKEIMLAQPDEVSPAEFQVLLPVLLRLLKRAQSNG